MQQTDNRFRFKVKYARRIPDPIFQPPLSSPAERHVFFCEVESIPDHLPKSPNPRKQNIDKRIYKDVAAHLLNQEGTPNTFHLKNKGITILAEQVVKVDDEHYDVLINEVSVQGIADGAHTYEILLANKSEILSHNNCKEPAERICQFVKIEVLTGIDRNLVPEIAGGLNTAVQVQQMALADLSNEFRWIKDELREQPYFSEIAFTQNEDGEYDIRDILVMLEMFNIAKYPNDGTEYPIRAYASKESVLSDFRKKSGVDERLRPILTDILRLHDIISYQARDLYNAGGGKKGGLLSFVENAKRTPFRFPFINKESRSRLVKGALYPILGAFRWMVIVDPSNNKFCWRDNDFNQVIKLWERTAKELMQATRETSEELGRKPTSIGKSANHWRTLHGLVMSRYYLLKHDK